MRRTLLASLVALHAAAAAAFAQAPPLHVQYYHLDAIGSVRAVTRQDGTEVRRHDYFPFGEEFAVTPGSDPIRFAGKERDAETGSDYIGARYYASRTGRMTTVDPLMDVEAALVDPEQWNRYAYARNNPLVYVDPTGAAIELIGSASDRDAALALFQAGVGDAGEFLYINELEIEGKKRYFVGIRGDVGRFMRFNEGAHTLANLIGHQSIVEFQLTDQNLGRWGGAVTAEPGELGNVNTRVLVNPSQVIWSLNPMVPATSLKIAGQDTSPAWIIRNMTPNIATWHEFGHAWGVINGRPMQRTNAEWENLMRAQRYGPIGPKNAPRRIH
jgi:RHS repeat-associated protein